MAYLYMHIPQIFPTGFFRGIQAYSCIDLKEDLIKGECYETASVPNRHLSMVISSRPYGQFRIMISS
jgi:hypothetical protein